MAQHKGTKETTQLLLPGCPWHGSPSLKGSTHICSTCRYSPTEPQLIWWPCSHPEASTGPVAASWPHVPCFSPFWKLSLAACRRLTQWSAVCAQVCSVWALLVTCRARCSSCVSGAALLPQSISGRGSFSSSVFHLCFQKSSKKISLRYMSRQEILICFFPLNIQPQSFKQKTSN